MVEVQLEHFGADAEEVMTIRNGSFSWSRNQGKPTLHDINVVVPKGKLIAIVGSVGDEAGGRRNGCQCCVWLRWVAVLCRCLQVGSGKSSLLAALLGELVTNSGELRTSDDRGGYVAQTAWIQNASLLDNVLFGSALEPRRYRSVIKACGMLPDLEVLPGGDRTEIGDRGINLR